MLSLFYWISKVCVTKGQTKSKWFYQADISSKKLTNGFNFTTIIPHVNLFSFVFWKKLKTPKRHFKTNWPLIEFRFAYKHGVLVIKTCYNTESQVFGGVTKQDMLLKETCFCWRLNGIWFIWFLANAYYTLLLDLPSESEGKTLVHFIQWHCPLNIKGKLPAAGNFSLKQRVSKIHPH